MKTIIFSILVLLILPLTVYSQVINFIKVENSAPSYSTVSDYSHIRVKYDPWGNVRIITYDGKRFFEVIYKNGEVAEWMKAHAWRACSPPKSGLVGSNPTLSAPIARGFLFISGIIFIFLTEKLSKTILIQHHGLCL